MSESDLWVLGKPAKDCPKDWLVVPVKDAVKHETEAVAKARKEEQHFIACAKSDAKYWKEKHAEDVKHYNNLLDKAEKEKSKAVREEQKRIFDWIDAKILEAQENQVCFDEYFSSGDLPEGCDSDYDAFKKRVLEGSE